MGTPNALWRKLTQPWGNPPPADYSWAERMGWTAGMVGFYAGGWYLIQAIVDRRGRFYDLSTPLDHAIRLVPAFAWAYLMIYVLLAAAILLIRSRALFKTAMKGVAIQTVIAFAFFLIIPVRMDSRPDEAAHLMPGLSASVVSFYYAIDRPYNLFPSMHLSLGVWSGLVLAADRPRWKRPIWFAIFWIGLSVVFIRQHYIADAVAGMALAWACRAALLKGKNSAREEGRAG